MIIKSFRTIPEAWHGIIDELAYHHRTVETVGQGGITTSYSDGLVVEIEDILAPMASRNSPLMHLDWSSYAKGRWNSFLKRYFREDLEDWVISTAKELEDLNKHQVAGYEININPKFEQIGRKGYGSSSKGHRHGACLASLQLQHFPKPKVIVVSRASQIDKAGFLDLCLMHLVAKRTGWEKVSGTWFISMAFIAAVSQLYYVRRFNKPLKGHSLQKSTTRFWHDNYKDAKYGPQRRSIKKAQEFLKTGTIGRSCLVDELSLSFDQINRTAARRARRLQREFEVED